MVTKDSIIKLLPSITIRVMQDSEIFLLNSQNGDAYKINESAQMIISYINGIDSLSEIFKKLSTSTVDNELTLDDVFNMAQFLCDNEVCTICS